MNNELIQEKLNKLPEDPGVYLMKDDAGIIIYVGKAKNLRRRVRQYFQSPKNQNPKTRLMVSRIDDFEYIVVTTEAEAFVLEQTLIKDNRPKYNILLKDDKQYPYIKITNENYPRVMKVRKILKDKAKYYGPFPNAYAVNDFLRTLEDLLHLRNCNRDLSKVPTKERPCLYKFTGKCIAPCTGEVAKEEYDKLIEKAQKFLNSKAGLKELIELLSEKMKEASLNLNYETAIIYRDKIENLKFLHEEQKVVSTKEDFKDIIAFAIGEETIAQIFFIRHGKIMGREYYIIQNTKDKTYSEILRDFLAQFYLGSTFIPDEIITETLPDDLELIQEFLNNKKGKNVEITVPKRGEKYKLLEMVKDNANMMMAKHGKRFLKEAEENKKTLKELQETLNLKTEISRIESFDISHIQGVDTVGGMVVFENGVAKKSDYRRFKINTQNDDYASMEEMLFRRFSRLQKSESENDSFTLIPDLILMDGGLGQVHICERVLSDLSLDIPVCGMVKDEFHKTRGLYYNDREFEFPKMSSIYRLLYTIQEEVHRFAISFHKSLRDKRMFRSSLDGIPDIGAKRKKELMLYFKDISSIKNATIEELAKVPSMNKRAANSIYNYFHNK